MLNNEKQNEEYNDAELEKMRQEVLAWIEKREKKNPENKQNKKNVQRQILPVKETKEKKATKKLSLAKFFNIRTLINNYQIKKIPRRKQLEIKLEKSPLKKIIILIIEIILLLLAIMVWGVYIQGWRGKFIIYATKLIPLPAIIVNGRALGYTDYISNYNALMQVAKKNSETEIAENEIKKRVIEKMIADEIIFQLATEYQVLVTDVDLKNSLEAIITKMDSKQDFEKLVKDLYGWTSDDFKIKILKPYLLRQKLLVVLKTDTAASKKAKEQIEQILEKIKNKELTFEDAAKIYSHDVTAGNGGELGDINRGQLKPEIEKILFNLEPGEVSEILKINFNYYIFKVDEVIKEPVEAEGEIEESQTVNSIKLRQVVISPSLALNELIAQKNAVAKIKVLVR